MNYDKDKVDEMTLALMFLGMQSDQHGTRAWKAFDWETLDRLAAKGYIQPVKSKSPSIDVTEEGRRLSEESFQRHFGIKG